MSPDNPNTTAAADNDDDDDDWKWGTERASDFLQVSEIVDLGLLPS